MKKNIEQYIEQEVKLRLLEHKQKELQNGVGEISNQLDGFESRVDAAFHRIESRLESRFAILAGLIIFSIAMKAIYMYFGIM